MGRIVLYLATSLDGFIAEQDGGVRFLERFNPSRGEDYGFHSFLRGVNATVMGSKTYKEALRLGGLPLPTENYVITTRRITRPRRGVQFYRGDLARLASRLKSEHRGVIWLMGGGMVASAFLERNLLDELIITVVPVLLGRGIPLYQNPRAGPRIRLKQFRRWKDGVVQLHYLVTRTRKRGEQPTTDRKPRRGVRGGKPA